MRYFRHAVVTGGAGFLGSHLCDRLIANGTRVTCLDNFLTGAPENVAHLQSEERFRLVRTDVTDYLHVAGDVDLVLHFASPASPADYLRLPIETMKVGSIGTLHALGLAKDKGARFVLASTSEAYGDPQVHPQPENYWGHVNPVGPRGVYDEAKRFAEALTTAYRTPMAPTPRSSGSSTPTVRGCGPTTAAPSLPSCGKRWTASRYRGGRRLARPDRCATSTTPSAGFLAVAASDWRARSTSAVRRS